MSISNVFTNNRSQAVRIPSDMRLPEGIKKVGYDLICSTVAAQSIRTAAWANSGRIGGLIGDVAVVLGFIDIGRH